MKSQCCMQLAREQASLIVALNFCIGKNLCLQYGCAARERLDVVPVVRTERKRKRNLRSEKMEEGGNPTQIYSRYLDVQKVLCALLFVCGPFVKSRRKRLLVSELLLRPSPQHMHQAAKRPAWQTFSAKRDGTRDVSWKGGFTPVPLSNPSELGKLSRGTHMSDLEDKLHASQQRAEAAEQQSSHFDDLYGFTTTAHLSAGERPRPLCEVVVSSVPRISAPAKCLDYVPSCEFSSSASGDHFEPQDLHAGKRPRGDISLLILLTGAWLHLMEQQLAAMNWKPGDLENRVQELERQVQERDRTIRDLELQVEEQKLQRQHDARQVEEKAQRIKDWVTCKLQELESENSLLVRENAELQTQVITLRQRLLALPANAAKEIYRLSIQEGSKSRPLSQCSDTPDLPDSSLMESNHEEDTSEQKDSSSPDMTDNQIDTVSDIESEDSMGEMDQDLYQEIDANHESIYELKPTGPPQIRIERKLFQGRLFDSLISSSNGSEEMLDPMRLSASHIQENGRLRDGDDGELIIAEDITPINLTPKSATAAFTFQTTAPPSTPTNLINMNFDPTTVTSAATLPRMKDKGKPAPLKLVKSDNMEAPSLSRRHLLSGVDIQVHHYSSEPHDVGTPEKEKRAYAVAHKRSKGWKKTRVQQPSIGHLFQEVHVPVYATLKGKAAQIRSTPFVEESSSDSSGDEEDVVITDRLTTGDRKHPPDEFTMDTLEKCGYLSKLSGKVKTWRRRFFVLRNGELFFYKSQHDVFKKPQGSIVLDSQTKITKSATELAFEITNSKKTYYLTADSPAELERWIRVCQRVLRRQATGNLLDSVDSKAVVKGWITKVKNGVTRRCWCVLLGRHFLYYKSPGDKTPMGQLNLQDAKLEEIEGACDSDDESDVSVPPLHVFAIWPPCQAPTYLVIPTQQEKDSWLYHLTVAAGGGTGAVGTDYEQFIAKLMQVNADPNSGLWKHPLMLYTKEPLREPLTTLPSIELQRKALELFKTLYQFMNTAIESPSVEFHVRLAQSMLGWCLEHPELQNEMYCQLIRQTSRHPSQPKTAVQSLLLCGKHSWFLCDGSPTSPTSSVVDLTDSKLNPAPHALTQGWQLLSLAVSLFTPKQTVTWLLKVHLHRHADPRSEVGKYAIYCQRALERTMVKGTREAAPSRMEVMSMLLRHPYHHSQPISIPVHFLQDSYQVVSFDGSTTVSEFIQSLNKMIGVRDPAQSGFALFADDPTGEGMELCLEGHLKVCDVISKWEQAHNAHASADSSEDSSRTIRLLYKNRLYFKSYYRQETEKEKLLLAYQVNEEIVHGRFPLNRDLALELASLMTQVEYGDLRSSDQTQHHSGTTPSPTSMASASGPGAPTPTQQVLEAALERFYPARFMDRSQNGLRQLQEGLCERWRSLRGRSAADCVRVYLAVARKWQFFGATVFPAKSDLNDLRSSALGARALCVICLCIKDAHWPLGRWHRRLGTVIRSGVAQVTSRRDVARGVFLPSFLQPSAACCFVSLFPIDTTCGDPGGPRDNSAPADGGEEKRPKPTTSPRYGREQLSERPSPPPQRLIAPSQGPLIHPLCGVKNGPTLVVTTTEEDVWLAVQEDGVSVLDYQSMQPVALYDYKSIMTFGGWRDDFMIVVTQLIESAPHHYEHRTEKFLFCMSKAKIHEITVLIASYINAKLQQQSPEGANSE
ncbi:hypothetical protein BaRGS_00026563 [Batillaria attramentaria]|uniref:Pleckstrin homology domain-containing family H member 2 n=1 Tax=Batillaria attramentaria TaxID=370345 RepID=A0ABD0K4N1_9CAEN